MGIGSTGKTFGDRSTVNNTTQKSDDRPVAQFWMNIGYTSEQINERSGEIEERFVSLKSGIALDTMETIVPKRGDSKTQVAFIDARNELRDQVLDAVKDMEPGETRILEGNIMGFEIQLLRIRGEAEAVKPSDNPFRRKLNLVA